MYMCKEVSSFILWFVEYLGLRSSGGDSGITSWLRTVASVRPGSWLCVTSSSALTSPGFSCPICCIGMLTELKGQRVKHLAECLAHSTYSVNVYYCYYTCVKLVDIFQAYPSSSRVGVLFSPQGFVPCSFSRFCLRWTQVQVLHHLEISSLKHYIIGTAHIST